MGGQITANYSIFILYQPFRPTYSLIYGRFNDFKKKDKHLWWPLETEADCEIVFNDFFELFVDIVLPTLEKYEEKDALLEATRGGLVNFENYIRILIELHCKNYEKAKEYYEYAVQNVESIFTGEKVFKTDAYKRLLKIPQDVFTDPQKSEEYLQGNIMENIEKLKLPF